MARMNSLCWNVMLYAYLDNGFVSEERVYVFRGLITIY